MALHRRLEIANDTAALDIVRQAVRDGIAEAGFPEVLANRIVLAVDEAVTNIMEHAFPDVPRGRGLITIEQTVDRDRYRVEIVDDGMLHYDPRKHPTVDLERHVSEGNRDGLGVFLMRRIMDVVDYGYVRGERNRLVMEKYAE